MSKKPNLAAALVDAAGGTKRRPAQEDELVINHLEKPQLTHKQPSRVATVPIMGHFPESVRNQMKMLALELQMKEGRKRTMQGLLGEALNDLFAKHGKPEIVPLDDK